MSVIFLGTQLQADQAWLRATSPPIPFLEVNPNPDPTLAQTLDLTWGR